MNSDDHKIEQKQKSTKFKRRYSKKRNIVKMDDIKVDRKNISERKINNSKIFSSHSSLSLISDSDESEETKNAEVYVDNDYDDEKDCEIIRTKTTRHILKKHEMVKLNVGGVIFVTSMDTLNKQKSILNSILNNNNNEFIKDTDSDAYFIDRDPKHFGKILNYLRYMHLQNIHITFCM